MFDFFQSITSVKPRLPLLKTRPIESTRQVKFSNKEISFTLRRSPKARNIKISVSGKSGLLVTIPMRASEERALQFLEQNKNWVEKQLNRQAQKPTYNFNFLSGTAKYLGEDCQIDVDIGLRDYAALANGRVILQLRQREEKNAKRALTRFYKRQARKIFEERTVIHAAALNVATQRIAIRGQTTKWGSCSHRGNLNFNWKLVMAPLHVIDYLIIHELSHLKHFNHGEQFWQTVEQFCPGYNLCEEWLEKNSALLAF